MYLTIKLQANSNFPKILVTVSIFKNNKQPAEPTEVPEFQQASKSHFT